MNIINRFDDASAIIEIGGGYGDVARIDRDRLVELLNRLPAGEVIISTLPHDAGRAVMLKHAAEKEPRWHVLAPVAPEPGLYERLLAVVGR